VTDDLVTLHVWRVPTRHLAPAMLRLPRLRRAARMRGARFVKVLGTADDRFTVRGATPTRWAMLSTWPTPDAAAAFESVAPAWWEGHAEESATLTLRVLRCRGRWAGRSPFAVGPDAADWTGPVAVVTRSRVRPRQALRFYRAVPSIAADVRKAPGLHVAFGVGEAPALWQGTVSVWDDVRAMQRFVRTDAHRAAVRDTPTIGWYAEELFAQFALVDATGTIDGRSVR
jgi:quinol monooxygenase YgiN